MSTTEAPTQRPQVDDATRAALLLAIVQQWHDTHPPMVLVPPQMGWVADQAPVYTITKAGREALAQDPSTDIPREPVRRHTEEVAA